MSAPVSHATQPLGSLSFSTNSPDYAIPAQPPVIQNESALRWYSYNGIIRVVKFLARCPVVCRLPGVAAVSHLFSKVAEFKKSAEYPLMQSRTMLLGSDAYDVSVVTEFEKFKREHQAWFQGKELSVTISDSSDSLRVCGGENVVVVNYANAIHPGGAALWGGHGSQEESLFRDTLLYASIDPEANAELQHNIQRKALAAHRHIPNVGGIFSPAVPAMHDFSKKYNFLSVAACDLRPKHMLLGPCGRHQNPERLAYSNPDGSINYPLVEMRTKWMLRISLIEMVKANITQLQSAQVPDDQIKTKRIDTICLGGLGCGAFRNDAKKVARWITEVLREPIFKGVFTRWIIPQGTNGEDAACYYRDGALLDYDEVLRQQLPIQPYLRQAFVHAVKTAN